MGKVNTHGGGLAPMLENIGLALSRETTVADDRKEMHSAFSEAWRRSDVVLCAGGLGPTFDDITRDVWSKVLNRPLVYLPAVAKDIEEKFRRRGWKMPAANRRQAYALKGARVLANRFGTAPGQIFHPGKKILVILPGPGRELFPMMERDVLPALRAAHPSGARRTVIYRLFSIAESRVDERLRPLIKAEKSRGAVEVVWGILAQKLIIDIKVTVSAPTQVEVSRRLERIDARVQAQFGKDIYGYGQETLGEVAGRMLAGKNKTLAAAESCTGGLLSQKITGVPGSSKYFLQGFITYSNAAKVKWLGVNPGTLKKFGAVSQICALEMAEGCRQKTGADFALAVTGIAGPDGGTAEKPVGLVFVALAGPGGTICQENRFSGERELVRERAALTALDMLRKALLAL